MATENNRLIMNRFVEFINTDSEKLAEELISPNAISPKRTALLR